MTGCIARLSLPQASAVSVFPHLQFFSPETTNNLLQRVGSVWFFFAWLSPPVGRDCGSSSLCPEAQLWQVHSLQICFWGSFNGRQQQTDCFGSPQHKPQKTDAWEPRMNPVELLWGSIGGILHSFASVSADPGYFVHEPFGQVSRLKFLTTYVDVSH